MPLVRPQWSIAKKRSIVRRENHDRILGQPKLIERFQNLPNRPIHPFDHGRIGSVLNWAFLVFLNEILRSFDRVMNRVIPECEKERSLLLLLDECDALIC